MSLELGEAKQRCDWALGRGSAYVCAVRQVSCASGEEGWAGLDGRMGGEGMRRGIDRDVFEFFLTSRVASINKKAQARPGRTLDILSTERRHASVVWRGEKTQQNLTKADKTRQGSFLKKQGTIFRNTRKYPQNNQQSPILSCSTLQSTCAPIFCVNSM